MMLELLYSLVSNRPRTNSAADKNRITPWLIIIISNTETFQNNEEEFTILCTCIIFYTMDGE